MRDYSPSRANIEHNLFLNTLYRMSASSLLVPGSSAVNPAYLWASGSVTLNGTTAVAVALPAIGADDNVVLTRVGAATATGVAITITAGTGFSVVSSGPDTGVLRWTWLKSHA